MSAFGIKIDQLSQIQKQGAVAALPGERIEEIDPELVDCAKQMRSADYPGFTIESLTELGNDMKRDGQHEPAVLRKNPEKPGRYLMVAGERRWRGAKMVGIKLKAVIRELTDEQARRVQRAENIQRENLTQLEIAVALREDKERLGTLENVAAEWNKGINWVAERIKFLEVVEADGHASQAVVSGVTADITVVNDLHRLEQANPGAAKAVIEQARADPNTNLRMAVREKLQDVKPVAKDRNGKTCSRVRELEPAEPEGDPLQQGMLEDGILDQSAPPQLSADMSGVVIEAAERARALCEQVSALSKLLQQHPDMHNVLADVLQSVRLAQTDLFRMCDTINALGKR